MTLKCTAQTVNGFIAVRRTQRSLVLERGITFITRPLTSDGNICRVVCVCVCSTLRFRGMYVYSVSELFPHDLTCTA
jgi:hypothetical protein